jgi:acyl-CoA synthetase (AMP-forming)/AMP-acid ligase II
VWLDAIHAHKGTATFGPNFAYALVAKKARPQDLVRWDLSRLRLCGCGAEPIHADTARLFAETFAPCGLSDSAFTPAYGLAEATLALTFKPPGAPMRTRSAADAVHVSCGRVVPGHAIEVRDENGLPLPDGVEGELCFRGPSICPGYFGNPKATAQTVVEGWLRTGDLGYVLDGEVYVTGRMKDLVILHGRNIHPQAIEWVAQEVEGVRKGNVVAFSRPGAHSEELVIALETRSTDPDAVAAAVRAAVQRDIGTAVADVVVLPTGALPKTSSGKLQRRLTRAQYIAGSLGREGVRTPGASDRITLARHVARSVWTRAKAAVLWR